MIKILFIMSETLPLPAVKGGAVEVLVDMLIEKNELENAFEFSVYCIYDKEANTLSNNFFYTKFHYIPFRKNILDKIKNRINIKLPFIYIQTSYLLNIYKKLKKEVEEFDYIIVENRPEFGLSLRKIAKNKLILHLHNEHLTKNSKLSKRKLNSYIKVLTVSNFINNKVREIKNDDKIQTLFNGIDTSKFDSSKLDIVEADIIRERYGIKKNDFTILFTGRIVPMKGIKELIHAFISIEKKENIKLIIAGKLTNNSFVHELLKLAESLKEKIIFTDYIKYDQLPYLYKIASVGVVPSVWNEPCALTAFEHIAAGNPVIVSKKGGLPEIVNSECAILVDVDNNYIENLRIAIETLINKEQSELDYMSKQGVQRARELDIDFFWSDFKKIMNNI